MELNCKIAELLPVQSGTSSRGEWVKNQFVVSWMDGQYEQRLCLEVMGADKWEKMKNAVVVGNSVLVKFNVTSREYNGRWFTTASCYYCSVVGGSQQKPVVQQAAVQDKVSAVDTKEKENVSSSDDLPF